jgi:galactitol-specific phosphotransferase system IIC component
MVWLVPFMVSVGIFPLKASMPALFEELMAAVLTLCVVFFLVLYFRSFRNTSFKTGIAVGGVWLLMCLVLDLLIFSWGPMQMSMWEYLTSIGPAYLTIPITASGFGCLASRPAEPAS